MAGAVIQVTSQFLGECIIDSIREQFPTRKIQRGDAYMDGGRHLLRMNMTLMSPDEKKQIELIYKLQVCEILARLKISQSQRWCKRAKKSKAELNAPKSSNFFIETFES
jgi:hypothetical protein